MGGRLREARERLGLTLEEVERTTRIRVHHLEAIERGELDSLPSPVRARGFLRNYAEFLGLEPGDVMLKYAEGLQKRKTRPRPAAPASRPAAVSVARPGPLRWLSADMLVAALVTVVVIAVLVWGGGRVMAAMRQSSENAQLASGFLIPTQTPSPNPTVSRVAVAELSTLSPTPSPAAFTPAPLSVLGSAGQVDLHLVVEKRTWLRVVVDGAEAFSGRAAPGQALPDYVGQVVEVWTGNGGGLRAVYNGQDQGLVGDLGEVVIRLWTTQGVLTPTPTQTPTPTETPKVSPTSALSPTPRPIRLPTTTPETGQ